ncbi:MAG: trigger factor [Holosporaceae bacterium]|jgi:trigger factor|nr:trigger factor [Holosporaceae bacterium]
MEITNRTNEGLKRSYNVFIPQKELEEAMTSELQNVSKKTKLDGFRPGKAPLDVVRRMYEDGLKSKVRNSVMENAVRRICKEENLAVSMGYEANIIKEGDEGLEFSFSFELTPSFELQTVSTLEIVKHVAPVEDGEVDEVLENFRKRAPKWEEEPKSIKVENGRKIVIDLSRLPQSGGKNKNQEVKDLELLIGDKNLLDNFDEHLVGKSIGDAVEFLINYPKNFKDRSVAGKNIRHRAVVKKIFKAAEHKLDDEFAKAIGFDDLGKAKEWAASFIRQKHEGVARDVMKRELLEKLSSMYEFDVPKNLLDVEKTAVSRQIREEGERLGKEITPHILDECVKIARDRVKLGFIVAEVARKEKIIVSRNEIAQAIRELAAATGVQERDMWNFYRNENAVRAIVGPLLETKVVDFLLTKVKVKEKTCSWKRLVEIDEEPFEFFLDGDENKKKASPKSAGKSEGEKKASARKKSAVKKDDGKK